jgi:delta-1-pyrroline-5-carboxylate synthetase
MQEKAIKSIMAGRKIGTFFTNAPTANTTPVETLAENGTFNFFFKQKNYINIKNNLLLI